MNSGNVNIMNNNNGNSQVAVGSISSNSGDSLGITNPPVTLQTPIIITQAM